MSLSEANELSSRNVASNDRYVARPWKGVPVYSVHTWCRQFRANALEATSLHQTFAEYLVLESP